MSLLARELTAVAVAPRARRASGNRASKFRRASTAAVTSTSTPSSTSEKDFPSFFPPEVRELTEPAAIDMAKRCELVEVAVPGRADAVLTSCVGDAGPEGSKLAPFVLLHGFDSSCLEYRRLFPKLAAKTETRAVD